MKKKLIASIPFALLAMCLFVMYGTNVGIPGITQYWKDFELLDMLWFYSADTVTTMLQNIGADGIQHYLYYFIVDFVFIVVLFFVQWRLSKSASNHMRKTYKFLLVCISTRGVFDLLEDLLLSMIITNRLPMSTVSFASCVTGLKFLSLYLWGATLLICLLLKIKKRKN